MKDYELFLQKALAIKDANYSVNCLPIDVQERKIIEKLVSESLIKNVRYIGMMAVGFDFTYDGLHYFVE